MPAQTTHPPYRAYAGIMGTFVGGIAVAGALARLLDRDPRSDGPLDLIVLGAATFKASRTITRDEVTSFLREPFVEGEAHEGGEEPLETGDLRQAVGELVTCSAASAPGSRPASPRRRSSRRASAGCSPGRWRRPASTTSCRPVSPP